MDQYDANTKYKYSQIYANISLVIIKLLFITYKLN